MQDCNSNTTKARRHLHKSTSAPHKC